MHVYEVASLSPTEQRERLIGRELVARKDGTKGGLLRRVQARVPGEIQRRALARIRDLKLHETRYSTTHLDPEASFVQGALQSRPQTINRISSCPEVVEIPSRSINEPEHHQRTAPASANPSASESSAIVRATLCWRWLSGTRYAP